jgi:hypothetical protein
MMLQTEFAFTLPHGYVDAEGNVHRDGELPQINPKVIEGLFAADFAFLQDFYRRINVNGHARVGATCPECEAKFEVEVNASGE